MAEVRSVSVVLSAKVNQFKADMAAAGKSASDAAQKTETAWDKSTTGAGKAMASIGKYQAEMTTAGTAMATFGGVVVGSLGLATKAAMSWESAWTGVLKTVDGTPRQLAAVEKGLRSLAKTLPATHEEIAAVAEAAGQLGIKTDNVVAFTKTMIDMGESTNISAEEAATSLARLANIMGTSQKKFSNMGASIVGLGNNFATTEREIVDMSMRVAAVGKQSGLTEGQVFGLATALSSVGIEAEAGGTAISMVMKKITNEVGSGGDKLDEFARIAGMSSSQFATAWQTDAAGALDAFVAGLGRAGASGENVNSTLTALGITGIRESDALLRLAGASDVLSNALKQGNEEFDKGTALAEEASKRYETAESKIKIAGNSLKDTAITIGGTFLPALAEGAKAVAGFADIIGGLPDPVLKVGTALAGIAGAVGLVAGATLILTPKIADTITAFGTLRTKVHESNGILGKFQGTAGKAKGVLVGLGKAAGVAAGAMAAVSIAGALDNSAKIAGAEELGQALLNVADGGEGAADALNNAAFKNVVEEMGGGANATRTFGEALARVSDKGFEDTVNSWATGLTGYRSEIGDTEEAIRSADTALAGFAASGSLEQAGAGFAEIARQGKDAGVSLQETAQQFPQYIDALRSQATQLGVTLTEQELLNWAMGEVPAKVQVAAASSDVASGAIAGVGDAANEASGGLKTMLDNLLALGIIQQSEMEAMSSYEAAIDGISEAVKENGRTLDITTEKGRANQDALFGIANAGRDAAGAMAENGASQEQVQGQLQRTYDDLVAAAEKFGLGGDEAAEMARKVLGIPGDVSIKTWMSDAAEEQAKSTKDALNDIPRKIGVTIDLSQTGGGWALLSPEGQRKAAADARRKLGTETPEDKLNRPPGPWKDGYKFNYLGNILTPMAAGGFSGAEMVPPNTWRIVGDRMDVDEAYVPLDGSRRSWKILIEALERMPGAIPMAKGGIATAQKSVDTANNRLREARRAKSDAKSKPAKAIAERRVRAAEDELAQAKKSLASAKKKAQADDKAAKLAEQQAKEAADRRNRVNELRGDLRTDIRRGSIRDQVTGGLSGGYSAVDRLFGLGANEDLSKGSRSRASSSARKFESNLRSLYTQAERIEEKLKAAKDRAQELNGIKDSVSKGLLGQRGIDVGDYQNFTGGRWETFSGLSGATRRMTADVGAMKAFAGKLKKLASMGIPGAILQEIAQAGVAEGSTMADAFLSATKAERDSYVGAWNDYEKYAGQAGQYVTEGFFKGGAAAADGIVKGLEGQQRNVESAIANLAKAMEATFKQVLGIKSPSRVMAELGGFTAEGLVQGMLGGVGGVQSAAAMLGAAAVPAMGPVSMDVGVAPVVADDQGLAGVAMQDMSSTTLDAMSQMQSAVSEGWAGMLSQTQAAQSGMLTDTQANQAGMLTATQSSQQGMLTATQLQQVGMLTSTQQNQLGMLTNTQAQQELMRATIAQKQLDSRNVLTTEQETMRATMADRQARMREQNYSDFESMRSNTGQKLRDMRGSADGTMTGFREDYSGHLGRLRESNREGFTAMRSTSDAAFDGIRSGMNAEMRGARPELGNNLNRLVSVFGSFTTEVNKAFGDVGVKLKAPGAVKFQTGGVMPGYTPGRDVHHFRSPSAGDLYLSGGEAIMRPEWTRAMGGEAGVKAQNDAAKQGRLDDLLHMQESGRFATGGVIPAIPGVNAFADAGVWRGLWGIVKKNVPGARLTSSYRPGSITASGNRSYHSRGMAVDLGGPMSKIFDFLYNNYRNSSEIIYSPANGRQIKNGQHYMYRGAVRGMHFNHVHWANQRVPGGGGTDFTAGDFGPGGDFMPPSHPFLDRAGVSAGANLEKSYAQAAQKLTAQIYAKHAKMLPQGIAGQLGKGIMSQMSEGLVAKAKDYGKSQTFVDPGGSGVERWRDTVVQALQRVGLPTSDEYVNAWLRQIKSESSGNPRAVQGNIGDVNNRSGDLAHGLVQVIGQTFAGFRDKSLPNDRFHPLANLVAGMNWAKFKARRQGRDMLSFIGKGHGYEDGTKNAKRGLAIVGESGPELVNFKGGEQVLSNPQSMRFMAENRTFIPNSGGGASIDYDRLAQAVVDNLPPTLVQHIDPSSLDAKRIGQAAVQEWTDKQNLYAMGVTR